MTALVLTALLTTAPTLPVVDGIDQLADEARGHLLSQIVAHQEYTEHMRDVWRHRRMEAKRAAEVIDTDTTNTPSTDYTYTGAGTWADELLAVGFPPEVIPTMLAIIERESGGDPGAINASSGACGLLQIFPAQAGCLDAMTNLRMGFAKYQAAGLTPWGM